MKKHVKKLMRLEIKQQLDVEEGYRKRSQESLRKKMKLLNRRIKSVPTLTGIGPGEQERLDKVRKQVRNERNQMRTLPVVLEDQSVDLNDFFVEFDSWTSVEKFVRLLTNVDHQIAFNSIYQLAHDIPSEVGDLLQAHNNIVCLKQKFKALS